MIAFYYAYFSTFYGSNYENTEGGGCLVWGLVIWDW